MVAQDSPAWAPSRTSISNRWESSRDGTPHSSSWYWRMRSELSAQSHRFWSVIPAPYRPGGRPSLPRTWWSRCGPEDGAWDSSLLAEDTSTGSLRHDELSDEANGEM